MNKQWQEEYRKQFKHLKIIKHDILGNYLDRTIQFISQLLSQREAEIRKETILAVLPEADWKPTCGYDSEEEKGFQKGIMAEQKLCRQLIIDSAKEKFNIEI